MTGLSPRSETIERLENGAYSSFAMLAGMQLDLFTPLKDGPMSTKQLAVALGVGSAKLEFLLYSLVAAHLLTMEKNLFSNTDEANRFLVWGQPEYIGHRHGSIAARYSNVLKTAESIRTGTGQAMIDFSEISRDRLEALSLNRHPSTLASGKDLVARYDFSSHRKLLDVGGGTGGVSIAVVEACPHIEATVVELTPMLPITRKYVEEAHASEQVRVVEGNAVDGALSGSFDVAVLRWLIQVLSAEQADRLIKNVAQVIEPAGIIYILGDILDDSRLTPEGMLGANLNYLNVYDGGQAYTEGEHRNWLAAAGFENIERVIISHGESIICARKRV